MSSRLIKWFAFGRGKEARKPFSGCFTAYFNHEQFSLAAIDGAKRQDWAQLPQVNPDDREVMEKGLLAAMGSDPAARVSRPKAKTKATMCASPPPFSPNMAVGSSEPRTKSDSRADPYWA